jgi:hypothetical protein
LQLLQGVFLFFQTLNYLVEWEALLHAGLQVFERNNAVR